MSPTTEVKVIVCATIFLLGLALGWKLGHLKTSVAVIEKPAPAIKQADGSVVLERKATTTPAEVKPPHEIPKGGTVEREVSVVVQPRVKPRPAPGAPCPDPEPVRVDLSLVRMPDQSARVVASSPSGAIVGGVDIPLAKASGAPGALPNAAGLSYGLPRRSIGAFYERDLARVRLGGSISYVPAEGALPAGMAYEVRAGWRF